jgi:hypothetical protein
VQATSDNKRQQTKSQQTEWQQITHAYAALQRRCNF